MPYDKWLWYICLVVYLLLGLVDFDLLHVV